MPTYTKSLLHMNGVDGSQSFVDDAVGGSHTWTAYGNAQIDTAQSKFGGASGLFDGTGDWIDTPDSDDFDVLSGDFTVDFWIKRGAFGTVQYVAGQSGSSYPDSAPFWLFFSADDKFNFWALNTEEGYYELASDVAITDSLWHHIACVRDGTNLKIFIDGVQHGLMGVGDYTLISSNYKFSVGRTGGYASNPLNGWIDEFRFSKGIARWTSDFTPPTQEYYSSFIYPSGITSAEAFGNPTVQLSGATIIPSGISSVEIFGYVKLVLIIPQQPVVKGKSPRPGETVVLRNKKVCFNICGGGLGSDGVDISTVKVKINGVEYDYVDPEFSYSGNSAEYYIEVSHPDFSYEQTVNININAESLANAVMETVQYGFFVEWESSLTRSGFAKIELYEPNKYDADALTIEEDWVRHGVERYTMELELWYGRYQKLPFVENLEFRILAGTTNALGKEILENGWLSVKVDGGIWIALYPSTVVDFGPMFTHSKKSLFFKLLVPETAVTTKYFLLSLLFELEMFFPYGRFMFSEGIYSDSGNLIEVHPDKRVYRAYVLSNAMWNALALLGFSSSPPLRGDDKQW